MVFLNNFTPDTGTLVSLPRILSSRYFSLPIFWEDAFRWGVKKENRSTIRKDFDPEQVFLPELLAQSGWKTAIFHNHPMFTKETYLAQMFGEIYPFKSHGKGPRDREIISGVISWLEKNREKPFFLYCHIMSPHYPYPRKGEEENFLEGRPISALDTVREKIAHVSDFSTKGWSEEELSLLRALYDGNLKHSDKWVGKLYDKLEEMELANNTLFIVTSDHGENLGEHNDLGHGGTPYDSVTHVPLVMVYPSAIPAGIRVGELTESIDIMPTILELIGLELPPGKSVDGESLLGLIEGTSDGKEAVYVTRGGERTIRTADHRYLLDRDLLFNLKDDPSEIRNISSQSPVVKEKLRKIYSRVMQPYRDRYDKAVKKGAPDYPFYIVLAEFIHFPKKFIGQASERKNKPALILKEVSTTRPWLCNYWAGRGFLCCLPGSENPPPITASFELPDGKYRISTLVEKVGDLSPPAREELWLNVIPERGFRKPDKVNYVPGGEEDGRAYWYLDWGEAEVRRGTFSIQLDFHFPLDVPWVIHHVKFSPGKIEKGGLKGAEFRRRKENLKALGYL